MRVLFHAVKRKQSQINSIFMFYICLAYFDKMNEAGKFFLALADCIITREARISFLMCFVVFAFLWFLLVHQDLPKPIRASKSKGKLHKSSQPLLAHPNTVPVILCQITIVSF